MMPGRTFSHTVPQEKAGIRLSDYLHIAFDDLLTRKGGKKAIKRGLIRVNATAGTTGHRVKPGDVIKYRPDDASRPKPYPIKLDILFEDDYLAVVHKPAGIPVSGNRHRTVQNALLANLAPSNQRDALPWPLPVHRLDFHTSGLLLVAKTQQAVVALGRAFAEQNIRKTYHAVVCGHVAEEGILNDPVEGKPSETAYRCISRVRLLKSDWLSLVALNPKTGRRHQLRIHLSRAGFPIVGDKLYGQPGKILRGKGLFLAATGLVFRHPHTGEVLAFSLSIPTKFEQLMEREQRKWESGQTP